MTDGWVANSKQIAKLINSQLACLPRKIQLNVLSGLFEPPIKPCLKSSKRRFYSQEYLLNYHTINLIIWGPFKFNSPYSVHKIKLSIYVIIAKIFTIQALTPIFSIGRRGMKNIEGYELREAQNPYNCVFDPEKCNLRLKNDYIWQAS